MSTRQKITIYILIVFTLLQLTCSHNGKLKVLYQEAGPIKTNCYLLYCVTSKEAALFDAGGSLDSLTTFIKKHSLNLRYIFLTHAHWDHVEGLFELKNKFPNAKVCLNKEEYRAMQEYLKFAKESDPDRFEETMRDSALAGMVKFDLTAIEPEIFIEDNEVYKLGSLRIRTLFTPGHSAGSMCFSCGKILFAGDVLLYRTVGNTDFYRGSRTDQIESVRKLYKLFPDSTTVYTGHGRFTDIGSEKRENKKITIDGGDWIEKSK